MFRLLHIAEREPAEGIWSDVFRRELAAFGELELVPNGHGMGMDARAEKIRACDVLLTGWGASAVPPAIATDRGSLRYICHVTGSVRGCLPREVFEAGIPVTNWGDAPANGVAEGAMTLLLATLKDLHEQVLTVREDGWAMDMRFHGGSLEGLNVGIYGMGVIGRRFVEMLRVFRCTMRVFDPYAADLPDGCIRVDSLGELFGNSEAIVIHAALTDQTRGSVTAALLSKLPRHGVVVNTARGGIIDQDALFRELESGRLRAGLDVLEPDTLPAGHPARTWRNLVLSTHRIEFGWPLDGMPPTRLNRMQEICLDNLRRFRDGEPLRFVMDAARFDMST